ncbi:outer membrane protein [Rhizobium sp. LjRoot254]|uniref:outer membrane protein n=1 Tax=Rhizobium sp. LjRoot254 TaxID=3342297 RepID=UPI003ECFF054
MNSIFVRTCFGVAALLASTTIAFADPAISIYGGWQTAPHSTVNVTDGTKFTAGWDGKSFEMPPYWGVRGTYWLDDWGYDEVGLALDFNHAKVYARDNTLNHKTPGWTHFEFTDGLNLATANVLYRFKGDRDWTPYLGAGIGANIPHVEVTRPSGTTSEYQLGGVTGQLMLGVDYKFTDHISAFTEYKFNYSRLNVDIDSGDKLKTNILTNAVSFGLTYNF